MQIKRIDFTDPQVEDLLRLHLAGMDEHSPPGTSYALDLSGLDHPDISFWGVWNGVRLAGMGALKELSSETAEIKSMRTHPDFIRHGVAQALLEHILATARERGYRRLSLETGTTEGFDAAIAFYRKNGFQNGEVFGDYRPSPFNQFMHLNLT